VGGAAAVLTLRRAALLLVAAWLCTYFAVSSSLWNASLWWDVGFVALVLMPSVLSLVYFALPYRLHRGLLPIGLSLLVLAFVFHEAHLHALSDFSKLGAMIAIGFWFLTYFETIGWVVLVSLIVPWVDAYSVWRGPTNHIVKHHGQTFSLLSFAFPVPGEHFSANLGLPDLLFFTLYLGAAARFGLRVRLTWLLLVLSLGATLALAVAFDLSGLPALPFLSTGFLLANCDLLWRELGPGRRSKGQRVDYDDQARPPPEQLEAPDAAESPPVGDKTPPGREADSADRLEPAGLGEPSAEDGSGEGG
jgi:hypothetical protein